MRAFPLLGVCAPPGTEAGLRVAFPLPRLLAVFPLKLAWLVPCRNPGFGGLAWREKLWLCAKLASISSVP